MVLCGGPLGGNVGLTPGGGGPGRLIGVCPGYCEGGGWPKGGGG